MKQVPRGSRIEKWNQDFQRNFYRLLRLRRGKFGSLQDQALKLTNNTKNKHTKKTPQEALGTPDEELRVGYNDSREDDKSYRGKEAEIGDKCRVLIKMRKNIKPILKIGSQARLYKSYHGRHFTRELHRITAKTRTKHPRYYVNGRWHDRDEILVVSGVDTETDRQVAARPK
jgi:hypothetical protein